MLALLSRALGSTRTSRVGSLLMLLGFGLVVYSLGAYQGIFPGGYASMPRPVALTAPGQRVARLEPAALPTTVPPALDQPAASAVAPAAAAPAAPRPAPAAAPVITQPPIAVKLDPADAADRREAAVAPRPGPPLRLALPTIKVDTEVRVGGVVQDKDGEWVWETLPFVATTYPTLGPVGAPGNPVIAGHVVTLREGNVFRDLYQLELGEPIEVYTADSHFTYVVDEIKLVPPSAIEVMAPTSDSRVTLITCGGSFDPKTRTFSDRLIVVGKLVGGERIR